jgi:putative peptide zinc metalloprotease protein
VTRSTGSTGRDEPPEGAGPSTAPSEQTSTFVRTSGVQLLGRYEGSGYATPRFLVVRPDGQSMLLTQLLYLAIQYADPQLDPAAQAALISRDCGRRLSAEQLTQLVGAQLAPVGLVAAQESPADTLPGRQADAAPPPRSRPLLSIALKGPLVPVWAVRRLSRWLAPAFHPAAIAVILAGFVLSGVWLIGGGKLGGSALVLVRPGDLLAVMALLVVSAFVHECGHAAGCHYSGGRPGAIGAALYLWLPVFWTEVTDVYRLDRRGRVRTDLGGLHFTALFVILATGAYALTGWAPLAVAALVNIVLIPQQLIPFVRFDGYYLLGDLTGVPNLFGLVGPILRSMLPRRRPDPRVLGLRRGTRIVVAVWVISTVLTLAASMVLLALHLPSLLGSTQRQINALWQSAITPTDLPLMLLSWVSILLLLLPFAGGTVLLVRAAHKILAVRRTTANQPDDAQPEQDDDSLGARAHAGDVPQ